MRLVRNLTITLVLSALLTASGCSKQAPEAAPAPHLKQPSLKEQAVAQMSKGDYTGATALWKTITEQEPSADNYNELSFAYLQAKRYTEALTAAEQALKLTPEHPYATYNAGMAALESGDFCKTRYLMWSVQQQPDRYEPHAALARLYMGTFQYVLALHEAEEAVRLANGAPDAKEILQQVKASKAGPAPADLASTGQVTYVDGDLTLIRYAEKPKTACDGPAFSIYAVTKEGAVSRVPMGTLPDKVEWSKVVLAGGTTGYLLQGSPMGAYVSHASAWYLLTWNGKELDQVAFLNPPHEQQGDNFMAGYSPYVRSSGAPRAQDGNLVASHPRDSDGKMAHVRTYRLSADQRTAAQINLTERPAGK